VVQLITMDSALLPTKDKKEERIKKQLQKAIERKQQKLHALTAKYEMLKVELDVIQHEYNVRIGSLFLKDNKLDIEIIRYKDILSLMQSGMSYEDAVLANEMKFYNTGEDFTFDDSFIDDPEFINTDERLAGNEHDPDFRALWKKLILRFHPDLVVQPDEKAKREEIMKRINNAYREKDYETLSSFELEFAHEEKQEITVEKLEKTLVYCENMIIQIEKKYKDLKESEWYGWKKNMTKAKKENVDVFKGMERTLLDDIIKKMAILKDLKRKAGIV
jgi:hypothetical protein